MKNETLKKIFIILYTILFIAIFALFVKSGPERLQGGLENIFGQDEVFYEEFLPETLLILSPHLLLFICSVVKTLANGPTVEKVLCTFLAYPFIYGFIIIRVVVNIIFEIKEISYLFILVALLYIIALIIIKSEPATGKKSEEPSSYAYSNYSSNNDDRMHDDLDAISKAMEENYGPDWTDGV